MSLIILPDEPVIKPQFDEEPHTYMVNGSFVPSVSDILSPLSALSYQGIDRKTLKEAAAFGSAVHACTEYLDNGELDESSVEPEWRPCLDAYQRWKDEMHPVIDAVEMRLGCSRYAGTLDRLCTLDGEPWIVDLKTTSVICNHVGVQLAAYEALAVRYTGVKRYRRAALQLRDDGTYRFKEFSSVADEHCFNNLYSIYCWRINHGK